MRECVVYAPEVKEKICKNTTILLKTTYNKGETKRQVSENIKYTTGLDQKLFRVYISQQIQRKSKRKRVYACFIVIICMHEVVFFV